jgi:serine/threonine protein kinase
MVPDAAPDHAYLMDFGLAERQIDAARRAGRALEGTVDYMAPEQAHGEPADPAVDVYGLACVLFHCLTGQRPFPAATDELVLEAHRSASRPSLSAHDPALAPADEVIAKGMAIVPADRPATPLALTMALRAALEGIAPAPPPPARRRPPSGQDRTKT